MTTQNQKEAAALCMEHLVDHDWHGYTWDARWGDGEGTCPVETPIGTCYVEQGDRDCSSGVISSYEAAGISCGGATYTGNMKSCMTGTGNFKAHRMSDGYNCDDGYIAQRGDTYLNESNHTAMCISSEPDMLAEFCINEFGGVYGGQTGDQTGGESRRGDFYSYPWDWCLECLTDGSSSTPSTPSQPSNDSGSGSFDPPSENIHYRVSTDSSGSSWLPEMVGRFDTGGSTDDFAGELGSAIRWISIQGIGKYRVCSQESGWLEYVDQYNVKDLKYGCAGDGSPIIALEIPNSKVRYALKDLGGSWNDDMIGNKDTGGSGDTFAGSMHAADAVRIEWA